VETAEEKRDREIVLVAFNFESISLAGIM